MTNDNTTSPVTFARQPAEAHLPVRSNVLAATEGLLLIGGVTLLDHFGIAPFDMWPIHPLLLVVILLSAQYGIQGGVLASMSAITITHFDGAPARPLDSTYADYFLFVWGDALSFLIVAFTVGVVTSHRGRVLREQSQKLRRAVRAEQLITAQYEVLAKRTHMLERSLASRADEDQDPPGVATSTAPDAPPPAWSRMMKLRERTDRVRKAGWTKGVHP